MLSSSLAELLNGPLSKFAWALFSG